MHDISRAFLKDTNTMFHHGHRHHERGLSHPRGGRFGRFLHERESHGSRGRHGGGRVFDQGDLRWVILKLISERPSHGYELIKALEDRSGGFYSPSPGMIYPALTWLEEVGYASVTADGAKKLYQLTAEGQAYLAEHKVSADTILEQLEQIAKRLGRMREAVAGLEDEDETGSKEVWAARRELKEALRASRGASSEEAGRIAQILKDAAAKIRG